MTYKTNTPNYKTKNSKISQFRDFCDNIGKEKEELDSINRSFTKNDNDVYNLPNLKKSKYNRVTRKIDDISKPEVEDKVDSIDIEKPEHKYKILGTESQSSKIDESIFDLSDARFTKNDMLKSFESGMNSDLGTNYGFEEWFNENY